MHPHLKKKRHHLKWMIPAALLTGAMSTLAVLQPPGHWSDRIVKAIQQFNNRFPVEKVYLHLDKDYYAAGETIWFKGYITLQGGPAIQATNLYVELLDKNNNVVQKKILAISNAGAPGNIELPETQKPGVYQLRAYTAWMLNFDPAFSYSRSIEIFDPAKKAAPVADTTAPDFAIQFFPEGGNLIAGQANQVAFKAIDNNGYPIEVTGVVKNGKGANSGTIKSIHDGMGVFEITPANAQDSYQAVVKSSKGQTKTVALPAAQLTGASLKIFNKGSRIFYQAVPANASDTALNELVVVAQMGQQLVYKALLDISEGRISGFIPADKLPSGILQVTLFAKNGLPLSERLTFVHRNDLMQIDVLESDTHKEPRKKNTFVLRLPDTLQTSISVAVTDADAVPVDKNVNSIVSTFLLTSDIKGYVYNPAWYFRNDSAATLQALDLVMMTNGWRRFSWEKIVNDEFPTVKFPYEQGLLMKGTATMPNGRLMQGGKLDMIIKLPADSSSMFASAPINEKGEFSLANMVFPDTAYIYYQGNDLVRKGIDVNVRIDNHFFERPTQVKLPYPLRIPPAVDNNALKLFLANAAEGNKVNRAVNNKTVYLKEVNVNAKKAAPEETTEKRYTSGMFAGGDGYTFDLTKEVPTAFNIFQYLQSKVAGLQITGDMNNPSLSWRGGKPGLYLNEMQSDVSMLSNLSIQDIALIKVFRPPFLGGFGGANGAIAVYTKKGGDNAQTPDPSIRGFKLYKKAGYSVVKQFYSPDYSVKKEVHALPDKRLTLYWSPNVAVDTLTHTATVEFYNNDFTKRFRLVVEGIGDDGSVGRFEQEY
ncbi:MG2 domain-containing protein [Chitinophaga nivalis]|uniref:MG2 domain-containing protein n=1 Tax=Chitinophaga nivalis TaxID=2991709 RepID=A0ABT3IQG6_9BACT|nr:MG2 domain-containing protein [Chitinophaga nivalis]MCW3464089.1 MG2 domain-containing protein [Chitinophaga nivalis]MCW3486221.1 MG2 domain-containing protein [Chitinophaga nivalis]